MHAHTTLTDSRCTSTHPAGGSVHSMLGLYPRLELQLYTGTQPQCSIRIKRPSSHATATYQSRTRTPHAPAIPPRIHPRSVTLFHTSAHSTPHWLTAARAAPRNLLPGARLPCANQLLTTHKRQTMHPLPPRRNPPAGPDKFCWQLWPREIRAAAPLSNPTARRAPQLVNWPASDVPSGALAAGSAWFTARLTPSLLALCSELAPVSIRMFSSLTRP